MKVGNMVSLSSAGSKTAQNADLAGTLVSSMKGANYGVIVKVGMDYAKPLYKVLWFGMDGKPFREGNGLQYRHHYRYEIKNKKV